jgi:hypothetical protein
MLYLGVYLLQKDHKCIHMQKWDEKAVSRCPVPYLKTAFKNHLLGSPGRTYVMILLARKALVT